MDEGLSHIVESISQVVEVYREVHSSVMELVKDTENLEKRVGELVAQCHHLNPEEIAPVSDSIGHDIADIIGQIDTLLSGLKKVLDEKDPHTVNQTLISISWEIRGLQTRVTQIENRVKSPLLEILSNKYSSLFGLDKNYVLNYMIALPHDELVGIRDDFTDLEIELSTKYPVGDPRMVLQKVFGKASPDKTSEHPLKALPSAAASTLKCVKNIVSGRSEELHGCRLEMLLTLLSMLPLNPFLDKTKLRHGIYSVGEELNKLEEALTELSKYSKLSVGDIYRQLVKWLTEDGEDVSKWDDLIKLLASLVRNTERVSNLFHIQQYLSELVQACEKTIEATKTRDLRTLCKELKSDLEVKLELVEKVDMASPDPAEVVKLIATDKLNRSGLEKISTSRPAHVAKEVMEKYIQKIENYLSDIERSLKFVSGGQHFLEGVNNIREKVNGARAYPPDLPLAIRQLDELFQKATDHILRALATGDLNEIDVSPIPVDSLEPLIKVLKANGKKVILKVIDQSDGNGL